VLVVLNKADGEAALVDPSTYEVLAKAAHREGPTRGRHLAGRAPRVRHELRHHGGAGHTITVLDLENREVEGTWDIGSYERPHGLALSRDGERLWVTSEVSQAAIEVDTATGEITKTWKTDQERSHMLVPTPDGRKLYVANVGSGSVTSIELETGEVETSPRGRVSKGSTSPRTGARSGLAATTSIPFR
jgi:DNA-binding beta-propeller fold protein YncE